MKKETVYNQWKEHRRQVSVPENATAAVMARIESQVHHQDDEMPFGMIDLPASLAQWSAAAGLMLLGIFRIVYIAATLFRPHLLIY
jgi:hypothetical protein